MTRERPKEDNRETSLWVNPVKRRLAEGKVVVGGTVTIPSVEVGAQMADMGFDFLWIEMEHSPITLETARNIILATRGLPAVPLIRVPVNELWTAKRAMDAGAMGVIFPFTSTEELARQAVAACRYGPVGKRGSGPGLAGFRWPAPKEGYHRFADRNMMVICLVENREGLEQVDRIASVEGIDAIFIGTSDLSYSLGYGGEDEHPVVQEAIETIVQAGRKNGVPLGRPASSVEMIEDYRRQGFTLFQSPSDVALLKDGARGFLERAGSAVRQSDPGLLY